MIYSQFFVFLHFIGNILQPIIKFNGKYLDISTGLLWDIILNISTISIMNEFHKYIVTFEFITFLGFSEKFI